MYLATKNENRGHLPDGGGASHFSIGVHGLLRFALYKARVTKLNMEALNESLKNGPYKKRLACERPKKARPLARTQETKNKKTIVGIKF